MDSVCVFVVKCETRAENIAINSAISKHRTHVRNPILDVNTCIDTCSVYCMRYMALRLCVFMFIDAFLQETWRQYRVCVYTFWNLNVFIYCYYVCTYWMISLISKHCKETTNWVSEWVCWNLFSSWFIYSSLVLISHFTSYRIVFFVKRKPTIFCMTMTMTMTFNAFLFNFLWTSILNFLQRNKL